MTGMARIRKGAWLASFASVPSRLSNWRSLVRRRSAELYSAVSRICNLQRARTYRRRLANAIDLQNAILRYSRLKICATFKSEQPIAFAARRAGAALSQCYKPARHAERFDRFQPLSISPTRVSSLWRHVSGPFGCSPGRKAPGTSCCPNPPSPVRFFRRSV